MSKRKRARAKKQANKRIRQDSGFPIMTQERLAKVETRLDEMRVFTSRAMSLAERLDGETLSRDNDLFWALVKYAENVQESVKQLDNLNKSILPALEEIPNKSQDATDISWEGFKKMREVLAHQFGNIDPGILWEVVTKEFPVLDQLLRVLVVGEGLADKGHGFNVKFKAGQFRNLPRFDPRALFSPGNSIVCLLFDTKGKAQCLRFSRINESSFRMDSSTGYEGMSMTVSLVGDGETEHLGHWDNLHGPPVTRTTLSKNAVEIAAEERSHEDVNDPRAPGGVL